MSKDNELIQPASSSPSSFPLPAPTAAAATTVPSEQASAGAKTAKCSECNTDTPLHGLCRWCGRCYVCQPTYGYVQRHTFAPSAVCKACADKETEKCEFCARVGPRLWPCHCVSCGVEQRCQQACRECQRCTKCSPHLAGTSFCRACRGIRDIAPHVAASPVPRSWNAFSATLDQRSEETSIPHTATPLNAAPAPLTNHSEGTARPKGRRGASATVEIPISRLAGDDIKTQVAIMTAAKRALARLSVKRSAKGAVLTRLVSPRRPVGRPAVVATPLAAAAAPAATAPVAASSPESEFDAMADTKREMLETMSPTQLWQLATSVAIRPFGMGHHELVERLAQCPHCKIEDIIYLQNKEEEERHERRVEHREKRDRKSDD